MLNVDNIQLTQTNTKFVKTMPQSYDVYYNSTYICLLEYINESYILKLNNIKYTLNIPKSLILNKYIDDNFINILKNEIIKYIKI